MSHTSINNNTGAISALRGYRKQFLYSLYRILGATTDEDTFHPEGHFEDLDIYAPSGQLTEIIQVKDLKDKLTLSDIINAKDNSFLRRALKVTANGDCPQIKLVSYGETNEDIQKLANDTYDAKFKNRLKSFGLKDKDIPVLEKDFCVEIVSEEYIHNAILSKIHELKILSDPSISLDLLIYWIYKAAEKQSVIHKGILKDQLLAIGKFEKERENFHRHFNSLIRPLVREKQDSRLREKLKQDFYQGISATYSHIQADVDVVRTEKLNRINGKFKETNIVFIHGASGQGKSTLCYRYLHDYCTDAAVFILSRLPGDIQQIYEVISSLEGISKGLQFPVTLYIDVEPGQKDWINIIKELSPKTHFNFLVSIREEDWNSIEIQDLFSFDEIELYFDEDEAFLIYESLNELHTDLTYLDFDNAWEVFGGKGPLLEFVYLITQKESLPSKLKSQINAIINNDAATSTQKINLLRYITLADSYGAEICYKDIGKFLEYAGFIQLTGFLEKEYLLRIQDNNTIITGLHPVRSTIIKNILFDNELYCEADFALDALSFISDKSIQTFYRNIFRNTNLTPFTFIDRLRSVPLKSWQSYYSVLSILLWKGIDDYVNTNRPLLDEVYNEYGSAWSIVINYDICGILKDNVSLMESIDIFTEEQREFARSVNQRLSDKREIFKYIITWLSGINEMSLKPGNETDWDSFAMFIFWIDFLKITHIHIDSQKLETATIASANYDLSTLSHLMNAFSRPSFSDNEHFTNLEPIFLKSIYTQYNILYIQKDTDEIDCLYFWDIIDEKVDTEESNIVHAKSIRIIELLRFAYPDYNKYKIKGVGHKISFITDDYDSSVKEIPAENLLLPPFVKVNSTFINLYRFSKRPQTWGQYVNRILYTRHKFVEVLQKQHTALVTYHKKKDHSVIPQYIQEYGNTLGEELNSLTLKEELLPQQVTDRWGNTSEHQSKAFKQNNTLSDKQSISIEKYKDFLSQYREYFNSTENYLRQSAFSLLRTIKERLKEDVSEVEDYRRISLVGNLHKSYLVLPAFQKSFRAHFEKFADTASLSRLEHAENKLISELCFLYRHFLNSENFIPGNASAEASSKLKQIHHNLQKNIEKKLNTLGKADDISFKIHYDKIPGACLIIAGFHSCTDSITNLSTIYNTLADIISVEDETSVKALIIDKHFSSVYILPLVRGRSLNMQWHRFKSYNLNNSDFEDLATYNLMPDDIPANIISAFDIQSWEDTSEEIIALKELLEYVNTMYMLAFTFMQYKEAEEIYDEHGEDIFMKYVSKTDILLQEHFQKAVDLFTNHRDRCLNDFYDYKNDAEKLELSELIIETYSLFYPDDKYSQDSKITTESIGEWLLRLESLKEKVAVIYFFYSDKVIERSC